MIDFVDKVAVIIPTTCEVRRFENLLRAINSSLNQKGPDFDVQVVVVVNGQKVDPSSLWRLQSDNRIQVVILDEGNVSQARYEGVVRSSGQYFCFLDDDDELLPASVECRLRAFREKPEVDIVVSNGVAHTSGKDSVLISIGQDLINQDPYGAFLLQNWFASPSSLFRRSSIREGDLNIRHKYFEWTYIFYCLSSRGVRFCFVDQLGYRVHKDTAGSASKMDDYVKYHPIVLLDILKLPIPDRVRREVKRRYLTSLNTLVNLHIDRGQLLSAWQLHLYCLCRGGWGYLLFTRHLLTFGRRS